MPGYDCGEHIDDLADEAYERERQREIDEGGKRNAAGISAEELFLQDVHADGAKSGYQGDSIHLNPFQSDVPAHETWKRGWYAGAARRMSRLAA